MTEAGKRDIGTGGILGLFHQRRCTRCARVGWCGTPGYFAPSNFQFRTGRWGESRESRARRLAKPTVFPAARRRGLGSSAPLAGSKVTTYHHEEVDKLAFEGESSTRALDKLIRRRRGFGVRRSDLGGRCRLHKYRYGHTHCTCYLRPSMDPPTPWWEIVLASTVCTFVRRTFTARVVVLKTRIASSSREPIPRRQWRAARAFATRDCAPCP